MKAGAVWALSIVFTLIAAGVLFERIGQRRDRERYARVGRAVDIGGRTLNIYCSGEGQPAVVLQTFSHMSGYAWSALEPRVAEFTRACWYDRAGYGWSDPGPSDHTMKATATDLHALLDAAGVELPVVMLGTGDAASEIRVYHGMYPNEVAGAVFMNGNGVEDGQAIPESARGPWAKLGIFAAGARGAACLAFPVIADLGGLRLANVLGGPRRTPALDFPPEQQAELDFLSDNPEAQRGGNMCPRAEDMQQVRSSGNLGDLPLIVLAARSNYGAAGSKGRSEFDAWNKHQAEVVQPGLAALSTRGRLVFEDHRANTADVVEALREVVGDVRRH